MSDKVYSEAELDAIAREVSGSSVSDSKVVNLSGKPIRDDWDEDLFIQHMYDNEFLAAVQQGYRPETSTFEGYLTEALATLEHRRSELTQELLVGQIDHSTYNNAKMVADMAESAIKKYLEKNDTKRLIGV